MDTGSKDLLWSSQKCFSPLASTSKEQVSSICGNNIDSQIISTQSTSPKTSLFSTETAADIIGNNITLPTGKLLLNYIKVLKYNLGSYYVIVFYNILLIVNSFCLNL